MKNIYIIFILFLGFSAYSQGENDNWYFGDKAAVNFSAAAPVALTNSAMSAPEACGSVSDAQGNLLFYTDGMTIWDSDHNIMPNGTGLSGTVNSAQVLIIGEIGNKDRYYVFTTADSYNNQSYTAYSIVDMTLGSLGSSGQPLGDVDPAVKNVPVLDNNSKPITTGAVTAVPHANGTDFWILIPTHDDLLAFLFDGLGFNTVPVASNLSPWNTFSYRSFYVKASPKLNYPVGFDYIVGMGMGSSLKPDTFLSFSFDNNSGVLLGWITGLTTMNYDRIYSEFNEDGTILYSAVYQLGNLELYKCDYLGNFTPIFMSSIPNFDSGQLQRNKDGEVYFSIDNSGYLGQILNPNSFTGCIADFNNLFLNGQSSFKGLPQLFPEHIGCVSDILLTAPETNNNYIYRANNSITTQTNYSINSLNIDMRAGNNILLLPDTEISFGSNYTAVIEDCPVSKPAKRYWTPPAETQIYVLGEKNNVTVVANDVKIFPNPTTNSFTIDTGSEYIEKWDLFDLSGKRVLQGKEPVGSVDGLAKSTYVLKVLLKNKEVKTHKLIVK